MLWIEFQSKFCIQFLHFQSDSLYKQMSDDHFRVTTDMEHVSQENKVLRDELTRCLEQNREYQEYVNQMTSNIKVEQDKCQT